MIRPDDEMLHGTFKPRHGLQRQYHGLQLSISNVVIPLRRGGASGKEGAGVEFPLSYHKAQKLISAE